MRHWTLMFYLAGDNDLDHAGVADLKEMKQVGSTQQVAIVAQFDRHGPKRETERFYLRKGGSVAADSVARLGETDTGDPGVLLDFVRWAVRQYPAERYMLVIWNHGMGWDDSPIYALTTGHLGHRITRRGELVAGPRPGSRARGTVSHEVLRRIAESPFRRALFRQTVASEVAAKAIALDDTNRDFLDNRELKLVLGEIRRRLGRKLDILGLDACLMSMVEVCYQVRGGADLLLASEETEPVEGWPYAPILADLTAQPTMSPEALCRTIVRRYTASYGRTRRVTLAASDLNAAAGLGLAVDRLAKALTAALRRGDGRRSIARARAAAWKSSDTSVYVDLVDFCERLGGRLQSPFRDSCQATIAAVNRFVLQFGFRPGRDSRRPRGLSIYFPQGRILPTYLDLDFVRRTRWLNFLRQYGRRM